MPTAHRVACLRDDAVFLVIRHIEKDEKIESMKAIIDCETGDGMTPVYKACSHGHVQCASHLVLAGAAAGRATKAGKLTPLFAAATKGHPACVEFLLKQPLLLGGEPRGLLAPLPLEPRLLLELLNLVPAGLPFPR